MFLQSGSETPLYEDRETPEVNWASVRDEAMSACGGWEGMEFVVVRISS